MDKSNEKIEENLKKSFASIREDIAELKESVKSISKILNVSVEKSDFTIKKQEDKMSALFSKDKKIRDSIKHTLFIAELGINHNGDLNIAKQMIDLAMLNGADAIKLQKKTPDLCVPEHQKNKPKDTPWGELTYLEYKKRMELGRREFDEIDRYCKEKGIIWFASPWDIPSIEFLEKYDTPCYKVPSAKLTDKEFLLKLRKVGKPVILSTGMSTEEEIKKAVKILSGLPLVIMHCHAAYPAKDENLNLAYIQKLKKMFPKYPIGYSGHELGVAASLVASMIGARIIERHITMDRAMWGTDQAASLDYSGIRRLVRDLKKIPIWIGDGKKVVTEEEKLVKDKLRNKDTL